MVLSSTRLFGKIVFAYHVGDHLLLWIALTWFKLLILYSCESTWKLKDSWPMKPRRLKRWRLLKKGNFPLIVMILLTLQFLFQLYSIDGTKFLIAWSGFTWEERYDIPTGIIQSWEEEKLLKTPSPNKWMQQHYSYNKSYQNSDYIFLMHFTLRCK